MKTALAVLALLWKSEAASCTGALDSFKPGEITQMTDLINKFRKAVGAKPLTWDHALQCQAQKSQDENGDGLKHSNSYSLPIKAGENLAGGKDVTVAAWMWFTEYSQQLPGKGDQRYPISKTGHYTATVWKGATKIGCGILRSGKWKGIIRCQIAGSSPPNMMGQYDPQVNAFNGEVSKFKAAGLDPKEVQMYIDKFKKWGILHPGASTATNIGMTPSKEAKSQDPDKKVKKAMNFKAKMAKADDKKVKPETKADKAKVNLDAKLAKAEAKPAAAAATPAAAAATPAAAASNCAKPTGAKQGTCAGTKDLVLKKEATAFLTLVNKLRKAGGSPVLAWDNKLMCQVQKTQDKIGDGIIHSQGFTAPIPNGENLASGCDMKVAAWMWFTEYTQVGSGAEAAKYPLMKTGHFTNMMWKANTKVACGILRKGTMKGIVRCGFAPGGNMPGSYAKQVPAFEGKASQFKAVGLKAATAKKYINKFKAWGILHPSPASISNLGLWAVDGDDENLSDEDSEDDAEDMFDTEPANLFATGSIVLASATMLVGGAVFGFRRYTRTQTESNQQLELLEVESGNE